jgi:hypothetical protein
MNEYSQKDLVKKLLEASNQIHKASTRGSGNLIVTSTQVSSSIKNLLNQTNKKQKCRLILQKIKEWKNNSDTI